MNDFTIVTSLFNINREDNDGRSWSEYLEWFEKTLALKCPMFIFISEDLVPFVEEHRLHSPTEICVQKLEEIPYYHLKPQIESILSSDEYKNKISDPSRIECQNPMYSIIQYSKFHWLKKAIEETEKSSKFYFWLDAGASRFFDGYNFEITYPSSNAIDALNEIENKFLIQMNMEYYTDLVNADILTDEYLLDNRSYILGSMFGGTEKAIFSIADKIDDIFINKMLKNNFVNNEQIALGYLVKQNPDLFEIYERTDGNHLSFFMELAKS